MSKKDDTSSKEELVQNFLKKNKNFFIKNPELLKELQFPLKDEGSEKVIDLQVYRYKKINQENIDLQNQRTKGKPNKLEEMTLVEKKLKPKVENINKTRENTEGEPVLVAIEIDDQENIDKNDSNEKLNDADEIEMMYHNDNEGEGHGASKTTTTGGDETENI